jgi:hypothetical protein
LCALRFSISSHGQTPVLNGFSIEFYAEAVILAEIKISEGIMNGTFDQQPFMIAVLNLKKIFSPPMPGAPGSWPPEHRQDMAAPFDSTGIATFSPASGNSFRIPH